MIPRKTVFALIGGFFLLPHQMAVAELTSTDSGSVKSMKDRAESGVINSIDRATSQMVISDMTYSYSAITLAVHGGGRTSGITALQPNQKIRFIGGLRRPGDTLGAARTVTEIWID